MLRNIEIKIVRWKEKHEKRNIWSWLFKLSLNLDIFEHFSSYRKWLCTKQLYFRYGMHEPYMRIISFVSLQAEIKVYLLQIRYVFFTKVWYVLKAFKYSYGFRSQATRARSKWALKEFRQSQKKFYRVVDFPKNGRIWEIDTS